MTVLALQIKEKRALNSYYILQQAATPDQITQQDSLQGFFEANVTTRYSKEVIRCAAKAYFYCPTMN
jgi:hypothetical protein